MVCKCEGYCCHPEGEMLRSFYSRWAISQDLDSACSRDGQEFPH